MQFKKIVAVEPLNLIPSAEKALYSYANEVVLHDDMPCDAQEMAVRIGDADAVLISYTSTLGQDGLAQCPNVKYIGMCCSLYSAERANVDIHYAHYRGNTALDVGTYGDDGYVD